MNAVMPRTIKMKFGLEPYSEKLIQEMRLMWDEHNYEVKNESRPDPDLTIYSTAQKNGTLRLFTARVADMLVGYQVFFVMRHPHRKYSKEACQDVLYLDPEVRKGMVGIKFIKWCDGHLEREGVKKITHQISARRDISVLFKRLGYELEDMTFSRRF